MDRKGEQIRGPQQPQLRQEITVEQLKHLIATKLHGTKVIIIDRHTVCIPAFNVFREAIRKAIKGILYPFNIGIVTEMPNASTTAQTPPSAPPPSTPEPAPEQPPAEPPKPRLKAILRPSSPLNEETDPSDAIVADMKETGDKMEADAKETEKALKDAETEQKPSKKSRKK